MGDSLSYLDNLLVSAIPRDALISERSDVPDAQPTIPLVLTYHPTNELIKNVMNRNFHLMRDDPDTSASFVLISS